MRPTRRGRPRGRPGRADARRPRPDRFEHGEFAYAETSPWPHFDQKLSLSTAMITRSRASYVSAPDPSCPVKSEEPPNQADAKRRTPNPFEHAERAYAGASPRPHLVTMYCFDNSHDHRGRGCPTSTPPTSLPAQVRRAVNSAFIRHGDLHVESGHEQRDELLRLQNRPTEVFAESDLQTLGPYRPYRADRDWTADPRG